MVLDDWMASADWPHSPEDVVDWFHDWMLPCIIFPCGAMAEVGHWSADELQSQLRGQADDDDCVVMVVTAQPNAALLDAARVGGARIALTPTAQLLDGPPTEELLLLPADLDDETDLRHALSSTVQARRDREERRRLEARSRAQYVLSVEEHVASEIAVQQIRLVLDSGLAGISREVEAGVLAAVETVEVQLRAPSPDRSIVQRALRAVPSNVWAYTLGAMSGITGNVLTRWLGLA